MPHYFKVINQYRLDMNHYKDAGLLSYSYAPDLYDKRITSNVFQHISTTAKLITSKKYGKLITSKELAGF